MAAHTTLFVPVIASIASLMLLFLLLAPAAPVGHAAATLCAGYSCNSAPRHALSSTRHMSCSGALAIERQQSPRRRRLPRRPTPTPTPPRPQRSVNVCSVPQRKENDGYYNELYDASEMETSRPIRPVGGEEGEADAVVDVAIVGAGIGGLCAGAILNSLYGMKVGIYESHYLPGGCAHAFQRVALIATDDVDGDGDGSENQNEGGVQKRPKKEIFTFDSGPTIVLGCSRSPYNPLRQILDAIGESVDWIPYGGWGMVEHPGTGENSELRWTAELGPHAFRDGPLLRFGGPDAVREFDELRSVTKDLVSGAAAIPAMAMRSGPYALVPLLRYLPELINLIRLGPELTTGTFAPYMDGPIYTVTNAWLRDWLDALAFSLSGLPASRTSAAAVAYVLYDMHRPGAALDYPRGGLGSVIDALVRGVEKGKHGSRLHLRSHVDRIDTTEDGSRAVGLTLSDGRAVRARVGVICNAPVWSLNKLIANERATTVLNGKTAPKNFRPRQTWQIVHRSDDGSTASRIRATRPESDGGSVDGLLDKCDSSEMTGSFLHLHLALNATGLDLNGMEAHYTVMDRGLGGKPSIIAEDSACGELNMIAVSNPCKLDPTLAPEGYVVVHAYGAGNEPYGLWEGLDRRSDEYKAKKKERAEVLWRAVESIIPDARERAVLELIGSPITHERFLRRPRGTYGAATEDYLPDGYTGLDGLRLCGDGIFPGIGVPAVALSGASAANSLVGPLRQWRCLDALKEQKII